MLCSSYSSAFICFFFFTLWAHKTHLPALKLPYLAPQCIISPVGSDSGQKVIPGKRCRTQTASFCPNQDLQEIKQKCDWLCQVRDLYSQFFGHFIKLKHLEEYQSQMWKCIHITVHSFPAHQNCQPTLPWTDVV